MAQIGPNAGHFFLVAIPLGTFYKKVRNNRKIIKKNNVEKSAGLVKTRDSV